MLSMAAPQYRFSRLARAVALAGLAAALVGGAPPPHTNGAQKVLPAQVASVGLADLEDAFWACDYVATTRGTAGADTTACTAVYEAIKAQKFDGDFDQLLEWWQRNKIARHHALAAIDAAPKPR
jgi:hypothetical protein